MPPVDSHIAVSAPCAPAPASAPEYSLGYLPALDGIRGLSVLLILGYHEIGPHTRQLSYWINAWYAVDMFFVVSGFLITMILLKEQQRTREINLKNFYIRRFLRIAPACYTSLIVFALWSLWSVDNNLKPFVWAGLYITNLDLAFGWGLIPLKYGVAHFWTLGMEEQFYLCWPNLMRVARRHLMTAVLSVIGAVYLWRTYLVAAGADWQRIYAGFDTRVDTLMYGALAALLLSNDKSKELISRFIGSGAAQVLILAALFHVGVSLGHPREGNLFDHLLLWQVKVPYINILLGLLVMSVMAAPRGIAATFFKTPFMSWTGKLSYGIYLWHPLVHVIFCRFYGDYLVAHGTEAELIQYSIIYVVAVISYLLIERPCLKLKSRFAC